MVTDAAAWAERYWASRILNERVACRAPGVDPEVFFPDGEAGPALAQVAAAKRICAECGVEELCLALALRRGEPEGIWGGLTPLERRALRARLRATASPGAGGNTA